MALRQCDKCSEMVDEAKAFCPGCGHAFVEEQMRKEASSFDTADSTVQLGQTMYNQMLSDLGLSVSKPQQAPEKRVEVLAPAAVPSEKRVEVLQPVAVAVSPERKAETAKPKSKAIWFILGGVFLVLGVALVVIVAGIVVFYWMRFR